jgi:hypothetical protein
MRLLVGPDAGPYREAIRAWGKSALAMMGATTVPWPAQPSRETSGRAIWVSLAGCGRPQQFCGGDRPAKLGNTPDVLPGPAGLSCMCRHKARHAETRWQRVSGPGTEFPELVVATDAWR